jgi:uncharacterized protein YbjT (DUF2867 family)
MKKRIALVAGATGLVGHALINELKESNHYEKIIVLVRRKIEEFHHKVEMIVVDFDQLNNVKDKLVADDVYCCLGTTMKKAGSKEAFFRVDYEYPMELAKISKENGAKQFLLVSAMGADKDSTFFYNRVKGSLEEDVKALGFQALHIFRPSLLLGKRSEKRFGEDLAKSFFKIGSFFFRGPLEKYDAIKAETVAKGMYHRALSNPVGTYIYPSNEIKKIAQKVDKLAV